MNVISKGNMKLGKNVWHTNLDIGPDGSCPGATSWCELKCYAQKSYRYPSVGTKYRGNLAMLRETPDVYRDALLQDLESLKVGAVFRFHTAGDIANVGHVDIIRQACESRPDVQFYLYTRSWRIPEIRDAIVSGLFTVPNLTVWASTDPSVGADEVPSGWREARVFDTFEDASTDGFNTHCPEQTGKRPSCEACGLCWNAKPEARLAFATH